MGKHALLSASSSHIWLNCPPAPRLSQQYEDKGSSYALCNQCGAPLKQIAGKKQKRFCSNKCRMAWWNSHPEKINRIAVRAFTCQTCGQDFESYGKRERKYCSRACYGKSMAVRF
jgi:ribosomal protein L34E